MAAHMPFDAATTQALPVVAVLGRIEHSLRVRLWQESGGKGAPPKPLDLTTGETASDEVEVIRPGRTFDSTAEADGWYRAKFPERYAD